MWHIFHYEEWVPKILDALAELFQQELNVLGDVLIVVLLLVKVLQLL